MKNGPSDALRFAVLATDVVLFSVRNRQLLVRLVRVNRPPYFSNALGLPGGLIDPKETAEEAARRLLEEKAAIAAEKPYVEQLYTFSKVDRDPRGRVVAVAYLTLVPWEELSPEEQDDSEEAFWCPISRVKKLAYDHNEILQVALERLRSRATYTTLLAKLMPKVFTLTELESAYATLLGTLLDKRNFRKKILKLRILKVLPHKRKAGAFRPAQLYSFASQNVEQIEII